MAVIRNLVVKISADISSLSKGLQSASKSLDKASKTFTKIGSTLTTSVTLPIIALGTVVVKTASEFEQSMANAASVAGATGEELERMTSIAREMGSKTVFSASDAADALYYMASAGYKVDQMADSIEATLNLASATQYDLAATTDIVIATLNQFNLEASDAERVTNVFAAAIGNSMASMDKLSNSMGYVGPVANSLGYEIEETVGALSVLYDAGYDGSTAGTTLRQALVSLMNPTSSALKVFEDLGLSFDELNPATNDFASIVDKLGEAGMDTAQAMEVFGARGGPGMLALMNQGGDAIREMTDSITGTDKATEMAAIQLDTLTGQTKILKSELEEIAIAFGDVLIPIIRELISKYISPLTKKMMSLTDEERKQIVKIAAIAAAIGPLFLGVGKIIKGVSALIKIVPMLFSKIGIIIAVITAIGAGLTYLYKTNEEFRNKVLAIWETIKTKILTVGDSLKEWWKQNGEAIMSSIGKALEFIGTLVVKVFGGIYERAKMVWPYIKEVVTDTITTIKDLWNKYGENIKNLIIAAFNKVNEIMKAVLGQILVLFNKVWPKIKMIVTDTISGIKNVLEKDGNGIMSVIKSLYKFISTIVKKLLEVISKVIGKLVDAVVPIWEKLKGNLASLWETIKELYQTLKPIFDIIGAVILTLFSIICGVINGIISTISPFTQSVIASINVILDIIKALCALLRGDFGAAWGYIKSAALNVWESIKQAGLTFFEFFKGFAEGFMTFFGGVKDKIVELLAGFWEAIVTWFNKVKDGIAAIGNWIWSWLGPFFQGIADFFKGVGEGISNIFWTCVNAVASFFTNMFEGIKTTITGIWSTITGLFDKIKDYLSNLISEAFNWGKNLINNIADGIKKAWNSVVDGVKQIGQSIKDFLGFGSPTKKGPGHTADEWIPNLLNMMEDEMYAGEPQIASAAASIASTLNLSVDSNKAAVGTGSSPFGDLLNGMLSSTVVNQSSGDNNGDVVLQIDGQTFARLIAPKLTKEYKRNGVTLREV
jgi:TP901 family phage tail tape measure protein